MATQNKNNGNIITGKVGKVVGVQWRTKHLLRSTPRKSAQKPSNKQLLQREKLSVASQFIAPLRNLINTYFTSVHPNQNGVNQVTSLLLTQSMELHENRWEINFSSFVFTLGILPNTESQVNIMKQAITLNWSKLQHKGLKNNQHLLTLLYYHEESKTWYQHLDIASREALHCNIPLSKELNKGTLHLWQFWTHQESKQQSTSLYLGKHLCK